MNVSPELKQAIVAFQQGDMNAYGPLCEYSKDYIFRYISKVVAGVPNTYEVACQIYNDTYVEISQTINQLQNADMFYKWASIIADKRCFAYISTNTQYNEEMTPEIEAWADRDDILPEDIMQNMEQQRLVQSVIDNELTQMQRLCLMSCYYNGMSQSDAANSLGVPVSVVRANLATAKKKITERTVGTDNVDGVKLYAFAPFMAVIIENELFNLAAGAGTAATGAVAGAVMKGAGAAASNAAGNAAMAGGNALAGNMAGGAAGNVAMTGGNMAAGNMAGAMGGNAMAGSAAMAGGNSMGAMAAGNMAGGNAVAGNIAGSAAMAAGNVAGSAAMAGGAVAGNSAGAMVAGVAAKTGLSLGIKIAIAVASTAAVVGGGIAIANVVNDNKEDKKDKTTTEVVEYMDEDVLDGLFGQDIEAESSLPHDENTEEVEPDTEEANIDDSNTEESTPVEIEGEDGWSHGVDNTPKAIRAAYQSVISNMNLFLSNYDLLAQDYLQRDYMYFDYDLDGERELVLYLGFYNEDGDYMRDVVFLDYFEDTKSVGVVGVSNYEMNDESFYCEYNGMMARYSWRTSPYESYLYVVMVDGSTLSFVLEKGYEGIVSDIDAEGMHPLPLYGDWELLPE